ncbi:DUF5673 domain-containing protein [Clostridium aestuarii]|uniref:DUF5673 domain-containing protein n=1 Tax=Clostridium aestuarii TaxID=338193 RepID=A0ABT4D787_9CLOT|nr:DUF5673 domain-containing protein [Clostridium aestuarii]MCY6485873.1 DUF5673 domain-containing protein [Clostridium aestuarii]
MGWTIALYILIIVEFYFVLKELNIGNYRGKFILKINSERNISIFWTVLLVLWSVFMFFRIISYISYKQIYLKDIKVNIFWIGFSLQRIITDRNYSQIRENGISVSSGFYKWNRFKSYQWISSNTIQFKVEGIFKSFDEEIELKNQDKEKIDEILQKHMELLDSQIIAEKRELTADEIKN